MNRKFRKAIQDTFVMPEEKRMEEFLTELEGLSAGKRKPAWAHGFAVASAAAAFVLFAAGIGITLKLHPKPDTNVPGTSIITETEPSVQPETVPEECGTAADEKTRPERTTSKADRTDRPQADSTSAAPAQKAPAKTGTQQSAHDTGTAHPAQTGKNPVTTPVSAVTAPVQNTVQTVPETDENNTRPKTLEEKEQILMKTKHLAALLSAAAIGSGSIPAGTNAEALPAHIFDRLSIMESAWDVNSDGRFDYEDAYYCYIACNCNEEGMRYETLPADIRRNVIEAVSGPWVIGSDLICEYFIDQYIGSEADIEALKEKTYTYCDWRDGTVIVTEDFAGLNRQVSINYENCFSKFRNDLKKKFRYSYLWNRDEKNLQSFFREIDNGTADLDLNSDGKADLNDIAEGAFFCAYIRDQYPELAASLETLTNDQLNAEYVDTLLAPIETYDENSGLGADVWNKCVSFLRRLVTAGYDERQFIQITDIYAFSRLGINEETVDGKAFAAYCQSIDDEIRYSYYNIVVGDIWGTLKSIPDYPFWSDALHQYRYSTKLDSSGDDDDFEEKYDRIYEESLRAVEAGDISRFDLNSDGKLDYIDHFITDVYLEDVLGGYPKEASILPGELWDRIDTGTDLDGDGISGDWIDVMVIQKLVLYKGGSWDEDIDKGISELCSGRLTGDEVAVTIANSSICDDKPAGDVNLDGMVSADDASAVLGYYASCSVNADIEAAESARMTIMGDVDNNGTVSASDASAILSIYAQNSVE